MSFPRFHSKEVGILVQRGRVGGSGGNGKAQPCTCVAGCGLGVRADDRAAGVWAAGRDSGPRVRTKGLTGL